MSNGSGAKRKDDTTRSVLQKRQRDREFNEKLDEFVRLLAPMFR